MVTHFFTPPGLYILIAVIFVLSLVIYWKRDPVKREIRRWRGKEVTLGPVKFERQKPDRQVISDPSKAGVDFGQENDFTGAKVKNVAGRDIRTGATKSQQGETSPGVNFGKKGKFRNVEIEDIAGRDLEQEE